MCYCITYYCYCYGYIIAAFTNLMLCIVCRYLTGNPCTEFDGYREFVVATLPQIQVILVCCYNNKCYSVYAPIVGQQVMIVCVVVTGWCRN